MLNASALLTSCLPGTNRYTIAGLHNQKYYNPNSSQDLLSAQIGTPFTKATTLASSSAYVSPHLTLGSIALHSIRSATLAMLAPTTLTYNLTIENTNNIDGFLLSFNTYYYIFAPTLACAINAAPVACAALDSQTLFMPYPAPATSNLIVTVDNLLNFIQPSNWTFKSVQTRLTDGITTYSDVDLYYNDGTGLKALQPSPIAMRVILPYNHVQPSATFQVIIDTQFSSFLPLKSFAFNFTTQSASCQLLSTSFAPTLTLTCSFPESANYNMRLQLYHAAFPSVPLSVGTSTLFIYPAPGGDCSNQMCDSCSSANGQ